MSELNMEAAQRMLKMQEQLISAQALYIQALQALNEHGIKMSTQTPPPPLPRFGSGDDVNSNRGSPSEVS